MKDCLASYAGHARPAEFRQLRFLHGTRSNMAYRSQPIRACPRHAPLVPFQDGHIDFSRRPKPVEQEFEPRKDYIERCTGPTEFQLFTPHRAKALPTSSSVAKAPRSAAAIPTSTALRKRASSITSSQEASGAGLQPRHGLSGVSSDCFRPWDRFLSVGSGFKSVESR